MKSKAMENLGQRLEAHKAVDLSALMRGVSNPDTNGDPGDVTMRESIEYIPLERIGADPANFYELSGIDELAENILLVGLQQPLRVREDPEDPERVILVSGHRRAEALRRLLAGGEERFREAPCIRERSTESAALRELRLVYANSDTRRMSPADISRQAERVETLLYQLQEEGFEFPGRMRDHVAQICQVSASKLARLKVIREKLPPDYGVYFETGKLSEAAAYALARQEPETRLPLLEKFKKWLSGGNAVAEYQVNDAARRWAELEKLQCPQEHNAPCEHVKRLWARYRSGLAYGNCETGCGCCCGCSRGFSCAEACGPMKKNWADWEEKRKAEAEERQREQEAADRARIQRYTQLWRRFGEARRAAGASLEDCYEAMGYMMYSDVATLEGRERGEGITAGTHPPYDDFADQMTPSGQLASLAELLGVTVDYLLCRTEEPGGGPAGDGQTALALWIPGSMRPSEPGPVAAVFDLGGGGTLSDLYWWDGARFRFKKGGETIDMEPRWWLALPEAPES